MFDKFHLCQFGLVKIYQTVTSIFFLGSSEECQARGPLNISISLSYFIEHPVKDLETLHERLATHV